MTIDNNNLIWLDLEMTGLNPHEDRILEIATVVTDSDLHILAEGPVFAIHQSPELLAGMDAWNQKHHTHSGLVARVQASQVNEQVAEATTLAFLRGYTSENKSPMCGNSIWQDRRFLARYMPELERFFHYRMIDVSTLKELALRWAPALIEGFQKESRHLALSDIHDSIKELQFYRDTFLNVPLRT